VLEVRGPRVQAQQLRFLLEDAHRWNRLRVIYYVRVHNVRITRLTDDRKFVSSTNSIELLGGVSKRPKSPMDSLRCRSYHSWEAQCRGCRAQFRWDVVVDLDEEHERAASRER